VRARRGTYVAIESIAPRRARSRGRRRIAIHEYSINIVHPGDEKLVPLLPQKIGIADACAWRSSWNDASTVALIDSTS
jgi:hypothetical protein